MPRKRNVMATPRIDIVEPATLAGATILQAETDEHDTLILLIRPRAGVNLPDMAVAVMSDAEGNGNGSLHIFDNRNGSYLGTM